MSSQIFISHSRRDENIRKTFNELLALAGVKSVCMEFEDMEGQKWNQIRDVVNHSDAVFVLMGENVNCSNHTQNWISFEVGLACAFKKRIWVFEKASSKVDFPIPYVTDYVIYDSLEKKEVTSYLKKIVDAYGGQGETAFFTNADVPLNCFPKWTLVLLYKCKSTYTFYNPLISPVVISKIHLLCPSCRQEIKG
ncbi:MAG: toll/interleukin-1 receptor domain-containing protein [Candidatus Bathyarchaeota archaeon]|nr:toll/interleukin-1 receptor domain-containing protein [Candidatus Bathyarchaeota archaeon]